jgi:putative transposase
MSDRRAKQNDFQGEVFQRPGDSFGGDLLKNSHAKSKRPLESKFPLHVVLRSQTSQMRLPKHYRRVNELVRKVCDKYGIRIYKYANVGNHLHLVIKLPRIARWAAFVRELCGRIALSLRTRSNGPGFWKKRPFTRIVRGWKKAYRAIIEYVQLNRLEAEGHIDRAETKTLKELRLIFVDG